VFLSFRFKIKVAEDLMQSGIEEHTFEPKNTRDNFLRKS